MHECHRERAIVLAAEEIPPERAPACDGHGGGLLSHLEFEGGLSDSGNGNGGTARGDVRYA